MEVLNSSNKYSPGIQAGSVLIDVSYREKDRKLPEQLENLESIFDESKNKGELQ